MTTPLHRPQAAPAQWQREVDLLADGRDLLERLCNSIRWRDLYPEGPSPALLFAAYQEYDRLRTVGRLHGGPRASRRAFRRMLRRHVRADVAVRSRRLAYGYPQPRLRRLPPAPPVVREALARVDSDARAVVESHLGFDSVHVGMRVSDDPATSATGAAARGIAQFREALLNEALARPDSIRSLHPQHLHMLATPAPASPRRPIATLVFVKVPLQLLTALMVALIVAYATAFLFFNDVRLGAFISQRVSGLLEGDLEIRSLHWSPRLIYDLVTDTPTPIVVTDVSVWSPYKRTAHGRTHRAGHAERIEATIVLSQIIPWTRLGIPAFLDIPWVLHFPEVRTQDPLWFDIRNYEDQLANGTSKTYLSLIDAFKPMESHPERRGLSFAVDDAQLGSTTIVVDYTETSQWRADAQLTSATFNLGFEAPDPAIQAPIEQPLTFVVRGRGRRGSLSIDGIEVPLADLELRKLASNRATIPAGDVAYRFNARAAGSPMTVEGTLRDIFARLHDSGLQPPRRVDLRATTPSLDGLLAHLLRELGLSPTTVVAAHSPATATVVGPLDQPTYTLATRHLSLDLLDESAWVADDVEVELAMSTSELPGMWAGGSPHSSAAPGKPAENRRVVTFNVLRGAVLDGEFQLASRDPTDLRFPDAASRAAHVVMPLFEDDPYLISVPLHVRGFNPGQLAPADPNLQRTLTGVGEGGLDLQRLVIGPDTAETQTTAGSARIRQLALEVDDVRVLRDRGPSRDGMPREIHLSGTARMGAGDSVDVAPLVVRTPGATLRADGAIDPGASRLQDLLLDLRIDDGTAFARSFSIPQYFESLRARALASGSLTAPSASSGAVTVDGVLAAGTRSQASFTMTQGRLKLRMDTRNARLFGGQGTVSAEIDVFENGSIASNPKMRATASLRGVDLAQLSPGVLAGRADVNLTIGDERGRPERLSDLQVSGDATSEALRVGNTTYKGATVLFDLSRDQVDIERLVLPIHRPVSPHFSPEVTVPVGNLIVSGSLTLEDDPALNLQVDAQGVPLATVRRMLELETPIYGQVSTAKLQVGGTLSRPKVDGHVDLEGLWAAGVALGSGGLDVASEDFPPSGPLVAHRELRIGGELSRGIGADQIASLLDAVVSIGPKGAADAPPVEAQLDVEFDRFSLATLLHDPVDPTRSPAVEGEIRELSAHLLACSGAAPMLSDCIGVRPPADQGVALSVALEVQSAWMRSSTEPLPPGTAPCDSRTTLCSGEALSAEVDWPIVRLTRPWSVRTGGAAGDALSLAGVFDLSSPTPDEATTAEVADSPQRCTPPPLRTRGVGPRGRPSGRGDAHIEGTLDLAPLSAIARSYGLGRMSGRLGLAVDVQGYALAPAISGYASLARSAPSEGSSADPLTLEVPSVPFPIQFRDLRLHMADGWLGAAGEAMLQGGPIRFGQVDGLNTGYGMTGPCSGHFGLAAQGRLSANVVADLVGKPVVGGPGGIDLKQLFVSGTVLPDVALNQLRGSLAFENNALSLEFSEGVTSARIDRGRIDFARCGQECPVGEPNWYRIDIGEPVHGPVAPERPRSAVRLAAGSRGRAYAWGRAYVDSAFERSEGVQLNLRLDALPYRSYDASGRPVYEVEITSDDLALRGGTPLVATGNAEIDRARYVKDAVQGVEILAFTDDSPEIQGPPPSLLQGMTFDIRVETDRPARMENNVASGLQADAAVEVTGTYEDPEFTGRLDIEPGGTVDIPFLTGTYEIQRGRVNVLRELENAEVDLLALRNEPIYIDEQPRSVQLQLGGTLSAVRWTCITDGSGGELDTVRGCTEYLVLGAGDVQLSENDVQQFGAGGLAGVRKPLQVVGHLTEFDVGERAGEAAPRIEPYVPDIRLRLGQIGPELEVATPPAWLEFDYAHATFGWDYTRGYPGFLLRQSREAKVQLQILDAATLEYSRRSRSYLNERVIFDPLQQTAVELSFDIEVPSLR